MNFTAQADPTILTDDEKALIELIYKEKGIKYDPATTQYNINKLCDSLDKAFPDKNIKWGEPDYLCKTMMELNLHRFGFDKNISQIYKLNQAVNETNNFNEFQAKAESILFNYNHNYLKTEYNFAIAASQNAANWIRQKDQEEDFPYLQYQTAGDDRVRDEHAVLDGKIFNLKDTSWQGIYPPNGYNCRCIMIQLGRGDVNSKETISEPQVKNLIGEEKYKKLQKEGFFQNRGETKTIFELNKAYINQIAKKDIVSINKLTYKDAKLLSIDEIRKKYELPLLKKQNITPEELIQQFNANKNKKGVVVFTDYKGRQIALDNISLKKHLKGIYINEKNERHRIFNCLSELIKSPDEVYLFDYNGKFQYTYIKYYKNETLISVVDIDKKKGLNINTWFKNSKDEIDIRKGIIIKNREGF